MLSASLFASSGGGLSKFFVQKPKNKGEAASWQRTIRVIDARDPWYYNQHRFQLNGRWYYMYCLGSPADGWRGHEEEMELDATGVAQCESIIIPKLNRPLHMVDDGGDTQFHFLVWEWDSMELKVLSHSAGGSLYQSLESLYVKQCAPYNTNLTAFDILLTTEPGNGDFFKYTVSPLVQSRDPQTVAAEIQAQMQQPEDPDTGYVLQAYNPIRTKESIEQQLQRLILGDGAPPSPPQQAPAAAPNVAFNAGFNPPLEQQQAPVDTSFTVPGVAPGPEPQRLNTEQPAAQMPDLLASLRPQ